MYLFHCFSNFWKPARLNCVGCCCSYSHISCSTYAPQGNSHQDLFSQWTKVVKISTGKPQAVWWVIKKFPYQLLNCLLIHMMHEIWHCHTRAIVLFSITEVPFCDLSLLSVCVAVLMEKQYALGVGITLPADGITSWLQVKQAAFIAWMCILVWVGIDDPCLNTGNNPVERVLPCSRLQHLYY